MKIYNLIMGILLWHGTAWSYHWVYGHWEQAFRTVTESRHWKWQYIGGTARRSWSVAMTYKGNGREHE